MKLYSIFAIVATMVFAWAQYNGYGIFDTIAKERAIGQSGVHSIFHK